MYEDGQLVDSMVVVVGKPKYPTPMMTAYVRFASLNPYWYVPPDLAAERIAPKVLSRASLSRRAWVPGAVGLEPRRADHRPSDDRLEGGRRRARKRCYPPIAGARTIRWGG